MSPRQSLLRGILAREALNITANADSALTAKNQALGAVRGRIDKWPRHRGPELGMTLDTG